MNKKKSQNKPLTVTQISNNIKYAISNNKPNILTKLSGFIDIKKEITQIYGLSPPAKISLKKLIMLVNENTSLN